jgi:hypothetical protein
VAGVPGIEGLVIPYCLTGTLVWSDGWRFLLLHGSEESTDV